MDSGVTERPDMRDRLIAPVIAGGVALGAAARMPGYVRLGGRLSSRSPGARVVAAGDGCAAGGPVRPRSRRPRRGLVLVTPHPGAAPCHDLALEGTGHADRYGRDSMIGRPVLCCPRRRLRPRLRRVLDRAAACCGTGLRCQCTVAKRPEGPALSRQRPPVPARARPAQVQLASPVDPVYPVPCADRGPAPVTRLIHLRHLPVRGGVPVSSIWSVRCCFAGHPRRAAGADDLGAPRGGRNLAV